MVVERPQSSASDIKGRAVSSFSLVEGEERASANTFGKKRVHLDSNSPKVGYANSPSSKEEVNPDVCGNGFVTARAKLVILLHPMFSTLSFFFFFFFCC